MILSHQRFESEARLVTAGRRVIRDALDVVGIADVSARYEVVAPGGIPDLTLFRRHGRVVRYVVTIEFKLANWRRALGQAFRHRNFGNEAYVVLDHVSATPAIANLDEFRRFNVGLLTLTPDRQVHVLHLPKPQVPFSPQLSRSFVSSLLTRKRIQSEDLLYTRTTRGGVGMGSLRAFLNDGQNTV